MNSRLLSNKWFTHEEILNIFCDVCEAVGKNIKITIIIFISIHFSARLHHSKTPGKDRYINIH